MQISDLLNSSGSTPTAATGADSGLGDMSSKDFMNLLITQLQNQDPFKPMGNEEMLNQMSNIRDLELSSRLTDQLDQLTHQQRFASVASLIGKYVRGQVTDANGTAFPTEGVVQSISFTQDGNVLLDLDSGEKLPLEKLQYVGDASMAA